MTRFEALSKLQRRGEPRDRSLMLLPQGYLFGLTQGRFKPLSFSLGDILSCHGTHVETRVILKKRDGRADMSTLVEALSTETRRRSVHFPCRVGTNSLIIRTCQLSLIPITIDGHTQPLFAIATLLLLCAVSPRTNNLLPDKSPRKVEILKIANKSFTPSLSCVNFRFTRLYQTVRRHVSSGKRNGDEGEGTDRPIHR